MRLKLFPFTLKDKAKIWLNSLSPRSIQTWTDLKAEFLKKFFPTHSDSCPIGVPADSCLAGAPCLRE